jgi:hypothetical protein
VREPPFFSVYPIFVSGDEAADAGSTCDRFDEKKAACKTGSCETSRRGLLVKSGSCETRYTGFHQSGIFEENPQALQIQPRAVATKTRTLTTCKPLSNASLPHIGGWYKKDDMSETILSLSLASTPPPPLLACPDRSRRVKRTQSWPAFFPAFG